MLNTSTGIIYMYIKVYTEIWFFYKKSEAVERIEKEENE